MSHQNANANNENTSKTTKSNNNANNNQHINYPQNVGILAMDIYYPSQYVDQSRLEQFDSVSTGKYTIGLGQSKMAFSLDNEDINSMCLTALNNMMEKYGIGPEEIGRLDVGTETLIDKSKSIKSCLMQLFEHVDNTDLEGVDNVNACFGGTAALFNAVNWIESSYWDGRFACVVMGDIALYAKGSARPTGGAGAIACLIGPNAPLVFERGLRAIHIAHSYDFYKPVMDSEYPVVDGQLTVKCYLNALDTCYHLFKKKFKKLYDSEYDDEEKKGGDVNNNSNSKTNLIRNVNRKYNSNNSSDINISGSNTFNLSSSSSFLFHSPYCKLVQKSFARVFWNDYLEYVKLADDCPLKPLNLLSRQTTVNVNDLDKFQTISNEESFGDKQLEKELVRLSEPLFKLKTAPSLTMAKEIGNMYTPSLYACLISHLLSKSTSELENTRICMFSYGSGLASAMFSILVNGDATETNERFSLTRLLDTLDTQKTQLLTNRIEVEPRLYDAYLQERELTHKKPNRVPHFGIESLYAGTWYLKNIDDKYRRSYARKEKENTTTTNEAALFKLEVAQDILLKKFNQIQLTPAIE